MLTQTVTTSPNDFLPPSTDINLLQWIMGQLGHAFAFLKYQIPDFIFGGDSYWNILLAVFIVGTIINLITGEDGDIIEDPTDDE